MGTNRGEKARNQFFPEPTMVSDSESYDMLLGNHLSSIMQVLAGAKRRSSKPHERAGEQMAPSLSIRE